MKHSANKKASKRAKRTKKVQAAKPVTTAQTTPVEKPAKTVIVTQKSVDSPVKAATGPKPPVDWAAAGRKAWETRQRNLAAGGAPVKKAKVAKVAPGPDAPITLDEIASQINAAFGPA